MSNCTRTLTTTDWFRLCHSHQFKRFFISMRFADLSAIKFDVALNQWKIYTFTQANWESGGWSCNFSLNFQTKYAQRIRDAYEMARVDLYNESSTVLWCDSLVLCVRVFVCVSVWMNIVQLEWRASSLRHVQTSVACLSEDDDERLPWKWAVNWDRWSFW